MDFVSRKANLSIIDMTGNQLLLCHLAELMLEHEQHILPVDLLFDDDQIGDYVKSIQIDSPYQQMLLDGVLTESVRDEKLYVSYTVEGYFHYVLGEVIHNRTEGSDAEALKQIVEENNLNGAKEGVEQCLILDAQRNDLSRLIWLIDYGAEFLDLAVVPLAASFMNFRVESCRKTTVEQAIFEHVRKVLSLVYNTPSINDDLILFKCIDYLKSKYCSVLLDAVQTSLDVIVQKPYYDENILVLLKLFPWIRDKNKRALYAELFINMSSNKRLSKYIKWEINSTLAFYLKNISNFSKAVFYHRKVMKYELEEIGKISAEYAESVNFSASLEIISGRYKEARKLYQKELKIREIISRDSNVDVFITRCFHSIALTFHYEGNYRKAIKNYEIALERRLNEGGRYCQATIGTLTNLGISFYEAGIPLAESYLEDALRIGKLLNGNYNDISTILPFLSRIKLEKGELDAAGKLLKVNLDNRELIFGSSSREVAFSHADLMNFYIETGCFEKALEHAQEQNKLLVRILSNNNKYSISSYEELGSVYYHLGMYKNAIESFKTALFLSKKHFKHDLKIQQELKYNKGLCYFKLGDYLKAKFIFMGCLRFERNGLLLNLIALSLSHIKPTLSIKYHLKALEQYKCEMSIFQLKEIEILNSVDNNSFRQLKSIYLSTLKLNKLPNWLQKAYDL